MCICKGGAIPRCALLVSVKQHHRASVLSQVAPVVTSWQQAGCTQDTHNPMYATITSTKTLAATESLTFAHACMLQVPELACTANSCPNLGHPSHPTSIGPLRQRYSRAALIHSPGSGHHHIRRGSHYSTHCLDSTPPEAQPESGVQLEDLRSSQQPAKPCQPGAAAGDALHLTSLTNVTSLTVTDSSGSPVDDTAAVAICVLLRNLQRLRFGSWGICSMAMLFRAALVLTGLKSLCIEGGRGCCVDAVGLGILSRLTQLSELSLPGVRDLLSADTRSLTHQLPDLQRVTITDPR